MAALVQNSSLGPVIPERRCTIEIRRTTALEDDEVVVAKPILGGLHHEYSLQMARRDIGWSFCALQRLYYTRRETKPASSLVFRWRESTAQGRIKRKNIVGTVDEYAKIVE